MSVAATRYPRASRLLQADDFQRVFKQRRCKSSDRYLTVLAVPNTLGWPRLGMAISIRNSGNAVSRNRLKRLVRESFRAHQNELGGNDVVVLTRKGISSLSNQQVATALAGHWQKIRAC